MQSRELGHAAEAVGRDAAVDAGVGAFQRSQLQCAAFVNTQPGIYWQLQVVLEPRDAGTRHPASTTAQCRRRAF